MALHKHSQRTVRKPCRKCARRDLYWAHDTDRPTGTVCPDCGVDGRFALIERDGTPHADVCGAPKAPAPTIPTDDTTKADDNVPPEELPAIDSPPAPSAPAPVSTSAPDGVPTKAAEAFQAFVSALTPNIDRDQVVGIVKDELRSVVFPTVTVVVRDGQEPHKVEGATHRKLADVIKILATGEHVLMVGPAGTGKSTLAEQAAEALGLPAYSLSLSPQTPSSAVFGYMQAAGEYVSTLFRQAYEHGGIFNFDEIDNGHPSILAAVNASLANGHAAFPDGMVKRHEHFRCVASANTYGRGADRKYVGRQALDAATLDRFTVQTIDIDEALEANLCHGTGLEPAKVADILAYVRTLRANIERHSLPVVVSPRASVGLCRLVHAGFSWDEAVDARARRGLSDADWAKISAGAPTVRV